MSNKNEELSCGQLTRVCDLSHGDRFQFFPRRKDKFVYVMAKDWGGIVVREDGATIAATAGSPDQVTFIRPSTPSEMELIKSNLHY